MRVMLITDWLDSLGLDMVDSWVQNRPEPILTRMYTYLYTSQCVDNIPTNAIAVPINGPMMKHLIFQNTCLVSMP